MPNRRANYPAKVAPANLSDIVIHCGECGCNFWFGIKVDPATTTRKELERLIREKLGDDASYICPRCESVVFVEFNSVALAEPERLRRAELARRIGKKARGVRFAVGMPDGPRSAVWRVWMNERRDDVYIAARGLASELKVSLHPDYWYYGFTDHHVKKGSPFLAPGEDRKRSVWERPPEFAPGWTRAFVILVPGSEVVAAPGRYEGSEAVWLPRAPDGEVTNFTVLLSKSGAARGQRGFPTAEGYENNSELITRLDLTTGEKLWVIAHNAPLDDLTAKLVENVREWLRGPDGDPVRAAMKDDPNYHARMLAFGDQTDGARSFLDVSADVPARAATA